jgi:plastocyanin
MLRKSAPITALALVAILAACGGQEAPPSQQAAKPPAPAPAKPAAAGYQVAAVADGGSIAGSVKAIGNIPAAEKVEITKDNSACGTEKVLEDITVGSGGELSHAVVWIEDIKSGKDWGNGSAGSVDQVNCRYIPHVQAVAPGATLEVINSDSVLHNIHAYSGDETLFNIAQPIQGQKTKKDLMESGPVHLKCDVHSWMSAWVFVAANPYYAVTGADGSFTLDDVPPGDYTVKVWHGKLGESSVQVTVEAGGAAAADLTIEAS